MNEIVTGEAITKYDVKEISTLNGMCYIIIPKEIFMTPYVDSLTLLIAKNSTLNKDKMDEVMVQISSNDTFLTIFQPVPAINNEIFSIKFDIQNNDKLLFLGFSLFDTLCMIVDFIIRKVNQKIAFKNTPKIDHEIALDIVVRF